MLWQFQMDSKGTQPYKYMHPLIKGVYYQASYNVDRWNLIHLVHTLDDVIQHLFKLRGKGAGEIIYSILAVLSWELLLEF